MNLIHSKNKVPVCLVVPPEAVRGLRHEQGQWRLYVSDPEPMAVSVFRLGIRTLERATAQVVKFEEGPRLKLEHGERLWQWLLKEDSLEVELVEAAGMPSMFPPGKFAGAKPSLGMPLPNNVS
jgi:hypothetical protein